MPRHGVRHRRGFAAECVFGLCRRAARAFFPRPFTTIFLRGRLPLGRPAADIAALLRTHPLFADIDVEALIRLIARGRMLALHPGDVLIQHGEASDAAYIVIEGCATVRLDTSYGAVSLSTVSAPALVGEIGVFMGVPRT